MARVVLVTALGCRVSAMVMLPTLECCSGIATDGGVSYGAGVSGSSIQFSTAGSYVVQFRAVDGVGLASAWAPASPGASNTACIN